LYTGFTVLARHEKGSYLHKCFSFRLTIVQPAVTVLFVLAAFLPAVGRILDAALLSLKTVDSIQLVDFVVQLQALVLHFNAALSLSNLDDSIQLVDDVVKLQEVAVALHDEPALSLQNVDDLI
jgi:hypothetical protein